MGRRAGRWYYSNDSVTLAQSLIGAVIVRMLEDGTRLSGRIVETEAYFGMVDAASHAYRGRRSQRNESMYGPPGLLYVYFTYGMHYCANIVCGEKDQPLAVLIRALEPLEGLETMRANRLAARKDRTVPDEDLCRGPGNLCRALGIDRAFDGIDLVTDPRACVELSGRKPIEEGRIVAGPRVGIGGSSVWVGAPLRFCLAGSRFVSGRRPGAARNGGV